MHGFPSLKKNIQPQQHLNGRKKNLKNVFKDPRREPLANGFQRNQKARKDTAFRQKGLYKSPTKFATEVKRKQKEMQTIKVLHQSRPLFAMKQQYFLSFLIISSPDAAPQKRRRSQPPRYTKLHAHHGVLAQPRRSEALAGCQSVGPIWLCVKGKNS